MIWSKVLELGHERIDAEHRLLLDLADEIEAIALGSGDVLALRPLYQEFHRILEAHCAYEEGLLRSLPRAMFGAQVDSHCRGHAVLVEQARRLAEETPPAGDGPPLGFSDAFLTLMRDLLIDDAELIGALIREGRHAPHHSPRPASSGHRHPPI